MRESTRELRRGLLLVGIPGEFGVVAWAGALQPVAMGHALHDVAEYLPTVGCAACAVGITAATVAIGRRARGVESHRMRVWWRYRARWGAAMQAAELVTQAKRTAAGKVSSPEAIPRLLDIAVHAGQADVLTAELIPGATVADWSAAAELLARRWHVHQVRVHLAADPSQPQVRLACLHTPDAARTFALHAPAPWAPTAPTPAVIPAAEPAPDLPAAVGADGGDPWDW